MGQIVVIEGILNESRRHYHTEYNQVVARLLHMPKGSLRKLYRGDKAYWYLRRYLPGQGYKDVYIGPIGDFAVKTFVSFVLERKQKIAEFKAIKTSLKKLGVTKMEIQDKGYDQLFLDLMEIFGKVGLWGEGLTLIGSWCFNVYVQAFGVEYFPLRTMDFDFGLRIPYTGDKTDIDQILKNLGFSARIDPGYHKVDYVLPGVGMVEVFIDREQASNDQLKTIKENLSIRPAALSYLHLLVDHPVTARIHGVHKSIRIPSMPSFLVHKLITAKFGEYRDSVSDPYKIRKDYKQASLVAKKILSDPKRYKELMDIIRDLPNNLWQKMSDSAKSSRDYLKAPDLSDGDIQHILQALPDSGV